MSEYDLQSAKFVKMNGIIIDRLLLDQKPPEECGDHMTRNRYAITIKRNKARNPKGNYPPLRFTFWGSAHDHDNGRHPSQYDILTCVSSEMGYDGQDAADIMDEFGPMRAKQARAIAAQGEKIRAFFTDKEQAELQEIR